MLRFPRHPDPFDYAPGSVDRGLLAFPRLPRSLLLRFAPILVVLPLADEVDEVLLFALCILPRSCETFAKKF